MSFTMIKVVNDLRILNAIGRRENLKFDKDYKYCIAGENEAWERCFCRFKYKDKQYKLQYLSGCFYPYLVEY